MTKKKTSKAPPSFMDTIRSIQDSLRKRQADVKAQAQKDYEAGKYNPLADNPDWRKQSHKQFIEGIKAPFKAASARRQTRANIKSMANSAAELQLMKDRKGSNMSKSARQMKLRQDKAYTSAKDDLENQVPWKHRTRMPWPFNR